MREEGEINLDEASLIFSNTVAFNNFMRSRRQSDGVMTYVTLQLPFVASTLSENAYQCLGMGTHVSHMQK